MKAKLRPPSFTLAAARRTRMLSSATLLDTVAARVYDHFGCWRWQPYSDASPRFAERGAWYDARVATQEVLPPFDAALKWMQRVVPRLPN